MNYLAENPIAIWAVGVMLLTLALVVYSQLRTTASLAAIGAVLLLTAGLLIYEHVVITPREAVAHTLDQLAAAIEANDIPRVVQFIAPAAKSIQNDANSLMPLVVVDKARITSTPEIIVDDSSDPSTALVRCQGMVNVTVKQNGMKGPYLDRVEIDFVRSGDQWLVSGYKPGRDWRRAMGSGRN